MKIKAGDVSPLAGMMTGEGLTGDLMRQGLGGAIPSAIARDAYAEKEDEKRRKQAAGMKKGGKVSSASSRADGCATKGKTRGKMV